MTPASKKGGTSAPAKPRKPRKSGKKRSAVSSAGKPLFLVLVSLALAVTFLVLGLLLLGPQQLLPKRLAALAGELAPHTAGQTARKHSRPAPAAKSHAGADTANGSVARSADGPPRDLPFEEHLSAREDRSRVIADGPEVRAKVERPSPNAVQSAASSADIEPVTNPREADRGPMMVVVIDDMGDHPVFAKNLTELPFPVTMAILPNRPRTRFVANLAAEHGTEIILHQPMQPGSYPRVNPGPGAVFTDMDAERIRTQLTENLAQLPNAVGINNHMGSAFTEYAAGMATVMQVLRAKGLFFLDSVTSATSAAPEAAHAAGVPLYRRAVFLDNVRNARTILGQLKTAERLALKHGRAIAIGHPYGETLEALRLWARERDPHIKLVTLKELGPES